MDWYEWIFDGLGTTIIGAIISAIFSSICGFISYKAAVKTICKQSQVAGDNSEQKQEINVIDVKNEGNELNVAKTIEQNNYNYGISYEQASMLYKEQQSLTLSACVSSCSEIAKTIVSEKIEQFAGVLFPKIQQIENDYQSFSDPSFLALLRKAQMTAACTGRVEDYKILSELLVHRIKNKSNVKKKASITRAVEIIDQIDDDSLLALTVFMSMEIYTPTSGDITAGLSIISRLYEKYDLDNLPQDEAWQDNLLILGAITQSRIGRLKKFEDYFSETLSGYVCAGIKKDSENYRKALEILSSCGIGDAYFEDNILLDGYVRLSISTREQIKKLQFDLAFDDNENLLTIKVPASKECVECLEKVFDMYSTDTNACAQAKAHFVELLNSYPSISKAIKWWNSIQNAISLTSVGRVIAHTNAKSIDPTLPDLD